MKKKLALIGGKKTIKSTLIPYSSIGKDEEKAALKIVKKILQKKIEPQPSHYKD